MTRADLKDQGRTLGSRERGLVVGDGGKRHMLESVSGCYFLGTRGVAYSTSFYFPLHPHPQRKASHPHTHCSIRGPLRCLSLRPHPDAYLLTHIPRGPHTGINLAETVPPNVKLGPDLVHHGAQLCQRWVCKKRDGDGAAWPHQPDGHVTRVRNNETI